MRRATKTCPDANSTLSIIPISTIDNGTLVAALQGSTTPCSREITSSRERWFMLQALSQELFHMALPFHWIAQRKTHRPRYSSRELLHQSRACEDNSARESFS